MESVLDVADILEIGGLSKKKSNTSLRKLISPTRNKTNLSKSTMSFLKKDFEDEDKLKIDELNRHEESIIEEDIEPESSFNKNCDSSSNQAFQGIDLTISRNSEESPKDGETSKECFTPKKRKIDQLPVSIWMKTQVSNYHYILYDFRKLYKRK